MFAERRERAVTLKRVRKLKSRHLKLWSSKLENAQRRRIENWGIFHQISWIIVPRFRLLKGRISHWGPPFFVKTTKTELATSYRILQWSYRVHPCHLNIGWFSVFACRYISYIETLQAGRGTGVLNFFPFYCWLLRCGQFFRVKVLWRKFAFW